jgi:endonuclease YncB( thermonuclease family)
MVPPELWAARQPPEVFTAAVIRVIDGDTLRLARGGAEATYRLYGIDTPEPRQPYGEQAGLFTRLLTAGDLVTVTVTGRDRHRRVVAIVTLPNGVILNDELVRVGLAWWYTAYAPKATHLQTLELAARAVQRGLWADPGARPPWEWRRKP